MSDLSAFAEFLKELDALQLAAIRLDAIKANDPEARVVIDAEFKRRALAQAPKMWERLRCEQCGREFESTNPAAYTCPRCDKLHAEAQAQTADMPAPDLTVRPWSKAAMRERLGTNTDRDE